MPGPDSRRLPRLIFTCRRYRGIIRFDYAAVFVRPGPSVLAGPNRGSFVSVKAQGPVPPLCTCKARTALSSHFFFSPDIPVSSQRGFAVFCLNHYSPTLVRTHCFSGAAVPMHTQKKDRRAEKIRRTILELVLRFSSTAVHYSKSICVAAFVSFFRV